MEYQIVRQGYPDHLQNSVNAFIAQGWEPQGAAFVHNGQWCQTMIKRNWPMGTSTSMTINDYFEELPKVLRG